MKKHLLFLVSCVLIFATSCNYISNPLEKVVDPITGDDCKDQPFPSYTSKRVVLLEDYTGATCLNCPRAADLAAALKKEYGDQLVCVAVHAGGFAAPKKAPYNSDYRTDAGEIYQSKEYFNIFGNPKGLINRKDFPTSHSKADANWAGEIKTLMTKPVTADLQLMSEYNSKDGKVCIYVKYKLPASLPNTYGLTLWLTQNNIVGAQNVYGTLNASYVFDHMLRACITGTWGDSLIVGTPEPTEIKYQYKIESDYRKIICVPKDCHIVGFIYDKKTLEVLQAAEVKVTN